MTKSVLLLMLSASVAVAGAQTASKPATHSARPASHSGTTAGKLPPALPVIHGVKKTMFSLQYEDYQVGTGPIAEPLKIYHVFYTGYLASTGQVFDASSEHRAPVVKDGKPVMGSDGKPELGQPQPLVFPQGYGRLIPGFDQGFTGMHVGGKRRIFIPWELGYGARDIPPRGPDHIGIPAKSDLIFDVELVDVTDMPTMPSRPGVPPHPEAAPEHPPAPPEPGKPAAPKNPLTSPAPGTPPKGTTPETPAPPPTTKAPTQPQ